MLENCKECGHDISISAKSCPQCGFVTRDSNFYYFFSVSLNVAVFFSLGLDFLFNFIFSIPTFCIITFIAYGIADNTGFFKLFFSFGWATLFFLVILLWCLFGVYVTHGAS